jgi:lipopolysaccharide/colanic/teichoic acid biosynthesis glycosyltransferase
MGWILPPEEFHRLLERERARVDRNHHPFSVVVFDLSGTRDAVRRKAAEVLRARRRLTDDLGWWEESTKIGAILPDTGANGAKTYAANVHEMLEAAGCDLPTRVFTYWGSVNPGDDGPPGPDMSDRRGSPFVPALVDLPLFPGDRGDDPVVEEAQTATDPTVEDLRSRFVRPLPAWKRAMDVAGASLLLVAFFPLLLLIAVVVKVSSPGPVIFRQRRAGLGGKPFTFFKFRTMYVDAEARKEALRAQNEVSGPVFKMKHDPRVTSVGRILRKASLDELPQLFNVLKGDMSLVGPRPPTLDEVPHYAPWQRQRLDLTGGLTGIWQVSGRAEIQFEEWMRMDIRYARSRSFKTDFRLLLRTVWAVLSGRGAV